MTTAPSPSPLSSSAVAGARSLRDEIAASAADLVAAARGAGRMIAVAESCTGGLLAGAITDVPGASSALERGFVTYSNAAKTELLGAPAHIIEAQGAVSEPVARAMAEGALARAPVDLAVAITGVAGPGGGTAAKPEGLVHFALAVTGRETRAHVEHFGAIGREMVRAKSVLIALQLLRDAL